MSRHFAVVGDPISHSKSPLIHTAAYSVLGKNFEYDKVQVAKNHLLQFVEGLNQDWAGLSVTAPLKQEALKLSSFCDETSKITGASNTLLRTEKGWSAFNTDVFGIQQALTAAGVRDINRASVIGSGATAMSAVLAISRNFPGVTLNISGRNRAALKDLAEFASSVGIRKVRKVSPARALSGSDLVVSTLPAKALDDYIERLSTARFRRPRGVFFDVAYEPWPSEAAKFWQNSGLSVISGIEMLLWQALAQVRVFSEGDPTKEVLNEGAVLLAMRHSIGLI